MRDQRRRYDSTRLPGGHIHSEAMHIQERFHRRDFGHMDMEVTVDDPVTPTKPVTVNSPKSYSPTVTFWSISALKGKEKETRRRLTEIRRPFRGSTQDATPRM